MRFCQKHGLHLISDEVYALSVWKNPEVPHAPEFTSMLAMNPDNILDRNLIHVIWGMSKVGMLTPLRQLGILTVKRTLAPTVSKWDA
jgi:aspartate/methionine/tyrosine aminotransferase